MWSNYAQINETRTTVNDWCCLQNEGISFRKKCLTVMTQFKSFFRCLHHTRTYISGLHRALNQWDDSEVWFDHEAARVVLSASAARDQSTVIGSSAGTIRMFWVTAFVSFKKKRGERWTDKAEGSESDTTYWLLKTLFQVFKSPLLHSYYFSHACIILLVQVYNRREHILFSFRQALYSKDSQELFGKGVR